MQVNRYTQVSPSQFNPLSMQEIFTVPLAKQKQHDQVQTKLDDLGLFDIERLSEDDPYAREYIDGYRNKIDAEVDSIMNKGVTPGSMRNVRNLINDRNKWLSSDQEGGKMKANYDSFINYKKSLDKELEEGDLELSRYNALLGNARKDYSTGIRDGNLNLMSAAKKVDIGEYLRPFANDLKSNPRLVESYSGMKQLSNGMYLDEKTGKEWHEKDLINNVLSNMAMQNLDIQNYLGQNKSLGLIENPTSYLNAITRSFDAGYGVDKITKDRIYRNPIADSGDGSDITDTGDYEYGSAQELQLRSEGLGNTLGKILNGEELPRKTNVTEWHGNRGTTKTEPGRKYNFEQDLNDEQKKDYDYILNGLKESAIIKEGMSPEMEMATVKKYMDTHNDIDYQPIIHTDGLFKYYDNKTSKMKVQTPKDLFKGISAQAENRVWIDPNTNKVINYDNLPKEDKELINEEKGIVSGVYSSKNFLRESIEDPISDKALISPYQVKLPNGKKYLVGRSQRELNSKSYEVDGLFNDIWRNTNKFPDIPYKTQLDQMGKVSITKLSDGRIIINKLDDNGQNSANSWELKNDDHLDRFIQSLYGITQ